MQQQNRKEQYESVRKYFGTLDKHSQMRVFGFQISMAEGVTVASHGMSDKELHDLGQLLMERARNETPYLGSKIMWPRYKPRKTAAELCHSIKSCVSENDISKLESAGCYVMQIWYDMEGITMKLSGQEDFVQGSGVLLGFRPMAPDAAKLKHVDMNFEFNEGVVVAGASYGGFMRDLDITTCQVSVDDMVKQAQGYH